MRLLAGLLKTLLILVLLAGLALLGLILLWQGDLKRVDDLNVLEFGGKATVVDAQGQTIGALTPALTAGARVNRTLLKSGEFSKNLKLAVVTSEDRRFYTHGAIDPRGLVRALFRSATGDVQGGSTITQQVVKNTLLADLEGARTPTRKLKEALLAFQVERHFKKDEILTAYLNVAYWGVGRRDLIGAQDAARAYFRTDASRLSLAQSVYLATLLPSPARYKNYPAYRPLMKDLLGRMVEDRVVTQAQADAAWREPITPAGWLVSYDDNGQLRSARLTRPSALRDNSPVPQVRYADGFLDAVERDLVSRLGRGVLYRSDVTVYTTLNRTAQRAAEAASSAARLPGGATLGLALISPKNGDVQALVGQKLNDGVLEEWNNATRSQRQVGSSLKPLLYTLALDSGWKQSDTVLDAPITGDYQPKNYSGTWLGRPVTLRYALDHSLNLPTVRLAQQVGLNKLEAKLRELGLSPAADTGLPLAIGALEASPLQLAAAYVPFANGGTYYTPRLITRVVAAGKPLLTVAPDAGKRVWSAETAWLGLDMIRGVVNDLTPAQGGLGWNARIDGREVGGKTGTTNDIRDLWFAGVTPGLVGATWIGRSDNAPLPEGSYSGDLAAPIWQAAVAGTLAGQPVTTFAPPAGIAYRWVRGVEMAFRPESGGLFRAPAQLPGQPGQYGQRQAPAQNQATQNQATQDQAAQDQAARQVQVAQDQAAQDQAAQDRAAQDQAAQAQAAADAEAQRQADEQAAQQAARDQAAQAQAAQDQAAQDQAARDREAQDQLTQAAQQQAAQAQAARDEAARQAAAQAEADRQAAEQAAQQESVPVPPEVQPLPEDQAPADPGQYDPNAQPPGGEGPGQP